MGEPVSIYELAENMIRLSGKVPERDIAIRVTGVRPGEKLHEVLWNEDERPSRRRTRRSSPPRRRRSIPPGSTASCASWSGSSSDGETLELVSRLERDGPCAAARHRARVGRSTRPARHA